uniref:Uncharacterized protein n=1 Tax=Trypanosoma vivax (strain Y486) TaxID=1055687 RepID=G0U2D3_TRYVY|nr:hypothetical protein TVY486_0902580 [Trypanosoma vivax Y486]
MTLCIFHSYRSFLVSNLLFLCYTFFAYLLSLPITCTIFLSSCHFLFATTRNYHYYFIRPSCFYLPFRILVCHALFSSSHNCVAFYKLSNGIVPNVSTFPH